MAFLAQTPQQDLEQAAKDMAAQASRVGWVLVVVIVIMLFFFMTSSTKR